MLKDFEKKTWDEFGATGLLWWINRTLHLFGWAIAFELDEVSRITSVYPIRTKWRGFLETSEKKGFLALTHYLNNNSKELLKEMDEL